MLGSAQATASDPDKVFRDNFANAWMENSYQRQQRIDSCKLWIASLRAVLIRGNVLSWLLSNENSSVFDRIGFKTLLNRLRKMEWINLELSAFYNVQEDWEDEQFECCNQEISLGN